MIFSTSTLRRLFRERETIFGFAVVFAALTVRLFHLFSVGIYNPRTPPDTGGFIKQCGLMSIDPLGYVLNPVNLTFAGFTVPFCSVFTLTNGSIATWLILQVILSATSCLLIFRAGTELFDSVTGLIAGLVLAASYDVFRWDVAVLSDTLFVFVVALSIWAIVHHYVSPSPRTRIIAWVALFWLAITRPHGVPMLIGWILFDLLPRGSTNRLGLLSRRAAIGVLAIAVALVVLFMAQLGTDLGGIVNVWRNGYLFWGGHGRVPIQYSYTPTESPTLVGFIVGNIDHLLIMAIFRAIVFFFPIVNWGYSGPDWALFHQVTLAPTIGLGLIGALIAIRDRSWKVLLVVMPLIMLVGTVSVTYIDWFTYRYRAPAGPPLALLCGYAIGQSAIGKTIRQQL